GTSLLYYFYIRSKVAVIFGNTSSHSTLDCLSTDIKFIAWNIDLTPSTSNTALINSGCPSLTLVYVFGFVSPLSTLYTNFIVFGFGVVSTLKISIIKIL